MSNSVLNTNNNRYTNGIAHPDLYLWDSWCYQEDNCYHLYCLAVEKIIDNKPIMPSARNDWPFHVRHFSSDDEGKSWVDQGIFQKPSTEQNRFDAKTIWSGSIEPLADGRKLVAYTGLSSSGDEIQFLQSIGIAISNDGHTIDSFQSEAISCPLRDWDEITNAGYYLDEKSKLGHFEGEEGGPILAWRDPFIFVDEDEIHLFWAAKIAPKVPAMAQATIIEENGKFKLKKLFRPVTLPDSKDFRQLELPKIIFDESERRYYLFVSTSNRIHEEQPESEVHKTVRLYSSKSIHGPWEFCLAEDKSELPLAFDHLFGFSVLNADFENQQLQCISPITEVAGHPTMLTFSPTFNIKLNNLFS